MCGIAGYVGHRQVEPILVVALERLKYRGYDSAGIAITTDGDLAIRKAAGRLHELEQAIAGAPLTGTCGIGHTRWATHGPPTSINAHPHADGDEQVAVVHNGIIENHDDLRSELAAKGAVFVSATDTEVIPHLLAEAYAEHNGDPIAAVRAVRSRLEGSYAFAAVFANLPDRIIAARCGSPLLLGKGDGQSLLASDVPALLPHAESMCQMEDGWIADLTPGDIVIYDEHDEPLAADFSTIHIEVADVTMGDFDSFMSKEIAEQPEVLARLIDSRLRNGQLVQPDLGIDLTSIDHIVLLACGTSWHAALLGKRFLEQLARVHVEVDISSEYRYRNPVAHGGTAVFAISQSGETADTLAGVRLARSKFLPVISLINVADSTIARESDGVLPLMAGPEIGVASTKAYTAQVVALLLFAAQVAQAKGRLDSGRLDTLLRSVCELPAAVAETLQLGSDAIDETVDLFAAAAATVFLGRGGEHPTALEGALKLKEIAYVHAMGYAAGEFKHGPIALVTGQLPVVCLCPRDGMREKMLSNIEEVRARAGRIIAVGDGGDTALRDLADVVFPTVHPGHDLLVPITSILPLQRYANLVARHRGCDVDQPRNLAKSVTVE